MSLTLQGSGTNFTKRLRQAERDGRRILSQSLDVPLKWKLLLVELNLYKRLSNLARAAANCWSMMRKGSGGEYSARQSAPLQSGVQPRSPGREPALILSSLPGPRSSLSLLTEVEARGPAADWMPDDPGLCWLGGPPRALSTPNLLLDGTPPRAGASNNVTRQRNRYLCITLGFLCILSVPFT